MNEKETKLMGLCIFILLVFTIIAIKVKMTATEIKKEVVKLEQEQAELQKNKESTNEIVKNETAKNIVLVTTDRKHVNNMTNSITDDTYYTNFNARRLHLQKLILERNYYVQKMPGDIDIKQDDEGNYYSYEVEKAFADETIGINGFKFRLAEEVGASYALGLGIDDRELSLSAFGYSYSCKMFCLATEYVMPNEEEKYNLLMDEQYRELQKNEVDFKIIEEYVSEYYRKIGYSSQISPDYAVTEEQFTSLFKNQLYGEKWHIDKTIEYRPGYIDYGYYSWGRVMVCRIPREQIIDEEVYTSDFSGYVVVFEYYNTDSDIKNHLSLVKQ